MEYPLAHDENGCPLDVPATAVGWLVRRHAGGRGRPAAVYDQDGRPLLVRLDATTSDLRAEGCRAGTYRLDAVDSSRRLLNVAAYTEVLFDGLVDGAMELASGSGASSDTAVAALARAVEAMQRVQAERERAQAERERVQAEMLARLVDRLAPPAPTPPRSLTDALAEFEQASKVIRNLAPEPELEGDEEVAAAEAVDGPVLKVIKEAVQVAKVFAMQRMAPPPVAVRNAAPPVAAPADESEVETGEVDAGDAEPTAAESAEMTGIDAKLDAVLSQLSQAEVKRVEQLSQTLPEATMQQAMQMLLVLSPEEGAATLRQLLTQYPEAPQQTAGGAS